VTNALSTLHAELALLTARLEALNEDAEDFKIIVN